MNRAPPANNLPPQSLVSSQTQFDLLAFELLGWGDVLPVPRMDGHEGNAYLTREDFERLCATVCHLVPNLTPDRWDRLDNTGRLPWMEEALKRANDVKKTVGDAKGVTMLWQQSLSNLRNSFIECARRYVPLRFVAGNRELITERNDSLQCDQLPGALVLYRGFRNKFNYAFFVEGKRHPEHVNECVSAFRAFEMLGPNVVAVLHGAPAEIQILAGLPSDPLGGFKPTDWTELLYGMAKRGVAGLSLRNVDSELAVIEPDLWQASIAALDCLGIGSHNDANKPENGAKAVTTKAKSPRACATKIPTTKRTRPMTLREAARLMGYGNSRDAAKRLRAAIKADAVHCETLTRQQHVFSLDDFPQNIHKQILPK